MKWTYRSYDIAYDPDQEVYAISKDGKVVAWAATDDAARLWVDSEWVILLKEGQR